MNLGAVSIVVRPRDTRESLDLSFLFLRRAGGRRYLWLCAAVSSSALGVCLAGKLAFDSSWAELWWFAVPLGVWLQGIYTLAAGDLMFTEQLDVRRVLSSFARRLLPYSLMLLWTRTVLALAALTVIAWPWVWSRVAFASEVCLLEGVPLRQGAARAARLGASAANASVELLVWTVVVLAFGVFAVENVGHAVIKFTLQLPWAPGNLLAEGGSLYATLGWFLCVPLTTTLRFLRYIDGRTRADGWDVQIRFQHVAQLARERQ